MSRTYHRAISVFAVPCTSKKYAIYNKSWQMLSKIISSFSLCAVTDSYQELYILSRRILSLIER